MALIISDQLRGFHLYVTSDDPESIDVTDRVYSDSSTNRNYNAKNGIYTIFTRRNGQFVHIQVPKENSILILCEVEVFEGNTTYLFIYLIIYFYLFIYFLFILLFFFFFFFIFFFFFFFFFWFLKYYIFYIIAL